MSRLGGSLAKPEPLIELERGPVNRSECHRTRYEHGPPVQERPKHRIPLVEDLLGDGIAADPAADDQAHCGTPFAAEVRESGAIKCHACLCRWISTYDIDGAFSGGNRPDAIINLDRKRAEVEPLSLGCGSAPISSDCFLPVAHEE